MFKNNLLRMICVGSLLVFFTPFAFAKTATDQFCGQVSIPDHPQRIVSLAPNITEIMFALGLSDRLVGATQYSDYPQAAKALPKVGSYVHLDVEKIVSLRPDLCIAVKDGNPIAAVTKLESVGVPVYAVDPRNLNAVMDTLRELGRLLDADEAAEREAGAMADRIERVKQRIACADHKPGVFFQIGISPIVSVGTPTFIHDLIVMAGGTNLAQGKTPYPRYSKEQVLGLWPDVMIISTMARDKVFDQVKAEWQQWGSLPAVKNDRIHLVDSNIFDRASPRLVQGLELLARLLHPQCFETEQNRVTP